MRTVNSSQCESAFQAGRPEFKLHKSFMCAKSDNGRGTCTGDGGSPFVCPNHSGQYAQVSPEYHKRIRMIQKLFVCVSILLQCFDMMPLFQYGVTAWGDKACAGEKPDAFADVSSGLGFIDWATKCVEGQDVDYFGLSGFKRWAKRQFCLNKERITEIKADVS